MTKSITIEQLHERSKKLGARDIILDVRTPQEYAEGHVPGSKNIPVDEVEARSSELKGVEDLYIYCRAGRRADMAAAVLSNCMDQLKIRELFVVDEGGFPDWEGLDYPAEK